MTRHHDRIAVRWIAVAVILALLFALSGCFGPPRVDVPDKQCEGTGCLVETIAMWIAGIAGGLLCLMPLLFIVANWIPGLQVLRKFAGQIAAALAMTIVASALVAWFGRNLLWFCVVAVVVGLAIVAVWARKHWKQIEEATGIDLDRDGQLG